jgi:hypothetical protein
MFKRLILVLISAVASCVDTNLNESEKAFESEFNKLYGDKEDEKKAAKALADAEKQVTGFFYLNLIILLK